MPVGLIVHGHAAVQEDELAYELPAVPIEGGMRNDDSIGYGREGSVDLLKFLFEQVVGIQTFSLFGMTQLPTDNVDSFQDRVSCLMILEHFVSEVFDLGPPVLLIQDVFTDLIALETSTGNV